MLIFDSTLYCKMVINWTSHKTKQRDRLGRTTFLKVFNICLLSSLPCFTFLPSLLTPILNDNDPLGIIIIPFSLAIAWLHLASCKTITWLDLNCFFTAACSWIYNYYSWLQLSLFFCALAGPVSNVDKKMRNKNLF